MSEEKDMTPELKEAPVEEYKPVATEEDVAQLISDKPGITASELAEESGLSMPTVYNRIAKLRKMMRVKTVMQGTVSHYYPFNFAIVEVPGMDQPGVPLRVGDATVTGRTLSAEQLKELLERPTAPTKYAELLGYLDRINIGEAAVFDAKDFESVDGMRGRIRTWFKENKKFTINTHGQFVIIERTK